MHISTNQGQNSHCNNILMYFVRVACRVYNLWGKMSKGCWGIILTTLLLIPCWCIKSLWFWVQAACAVRSTVESIRPSAQSWAQKCLYNLCLFSWPERDQWVIHCSVTGPAPRHAKQAGHLASLVPIQTSGGEPGGALEACLVSWGQGCVGRFCC